MKKQNKILLIFGIIVLVLVVASVYLAMKNCWFVNDGCEGWVPSENPISICLENNGKWLSEFNECEFISEKICTNLGGEFDKCESACRHDFPIVACTLQCVPVCKFQNIVGGDKDEHGCIGSAGYSWCETKQKCLRVWEEECYTCPSEKSVNCMPIIAPNSSAEKYCEANYRQWIQANCDTQFLD
jgi:hypothetical protein